MNTTNESVLFMPDMLAVEIENTTINESSSLEFPVALTVVKYAHLIVLPTSLTIGIFGNLITIIVMNQQRYASMASRYFLIALATADLSVILTQPFSSALIIRLIGFDVRSLSSAGCKAYFWFYRTCKFTSSWLVVCLALERLTAVKFPFRVKRIFSNRNAFIGIVTISVIISAFSGGFSYYSDIDATGQCNQDVYDRNNTQTTAIFRHMLNGCALIYFVAPLCILSVTTPLIILTLIKTEKNQSKLTCQNRNIVRRPTAMLLAVIFAFITLVTPIGIVHVLVNNADAFDKSSTWFKTFVQTAQMLEITNYAINFLLYVGSSQNFRKGVVSLFCGNHVIRNSSGSGDLKTRSSSLNK